jgi:hypothetical protein
MLLKHINPGSNSSSFVEISILATKDSMWFGLELLGPLCPHVFRLKPSILHGLEGSPKTVGWWTPMKYSTTESPYRLWFSMVIICPKPGVKPLWNMTGHCQWTPEASQWNGCSEGESQGQWWPWISGMKLVETVEHVLGRNRSTQICLQPS